MNKKALAAIFITLLLGGLVAAAGSQNSAKIGGFPLFVLVVCGAFIIQ